MKSNRTFLTGLMCLFFVLQSATLKAQDSTYVDVLDFFKENRVQWTKQIPELKSGKAKSKKGWFKRLIIGGEEISEFQKPVFGLPIQKNYWVIDQGYGLLFSYNKGNLVIPKVFKKKRLDFQSLVGGCKYKKDQLLLVDSGTNTIYIYNTKDKTLGIWNEGLELDRPTGIAYNKNSDELWVVETANHRISVFDSAGNRTKSIGSRGIAEGEFNYPTSICIDKHGDVYVVDALNYRVQLFNDKGEFITYFGENGNGTGFFAAPKGIATDTYGHIYIVDALFHTVQIFNRKGEFLDHFGNQGRNPGEFWMPSGIYIDNNNEIYVADSYNKRIQVFELIYNDE